ncbi:MAG TPA: ABC transporter ATP-binding protein [Feifaniaceae bacterium]|nr:ABC transporter ATP-binding protein [Feifaniaceae bacterium]
MFRKLFALSEQGDRDLKRGIAACTGANLSLILPVTLLFMLLEQLLRPVFGVPQAPVSVWAYTGLAALLLLVIYWIHSIEYTETYVSAYNESANRRITMAEKLRKLPLSFFGQRDLSELTTAMMATCTELEHTFSHAIPQLFGAVISILLVTIGLFFYEWHMALALFLPLPAALLLVVGSRRLQQRMSNKKYSAKLAAADGIQEALETMREIKACNRETEYLETLSEKFSNVVKASIRTELVTGSFVVSAQAMLRLGLALTILTGANLLISGEILFLQYLAFLLAASRLYDPLATVLMQLAEIFNAKVNIGRMQEIENQPVQDGGTEFNPNGYDIRFEHVTFSYNEDEVLHDVSFTAKQGEVTALVGPSGSGKSTAAKLAARFWDVNGGRVTIGGVDVKSVEPETLLHAFAIVFQDVVLFRDTIMANIRIGKRDATDEEVYAAARAAQCDAFVRRFPEGYGTVIGENGATLSGGERQRISIARALLKNAPVILLDEATASLDVENETEIQTALSALIADKTVLVIAHRMRTVAGADHIVVLENGHVREQGAPDALFAQNGLYRRMVSLQRQSAGWTING